ncbi:isoprenyl transferase [uncultured Desulfuromonas sp.]|uniref:isoprenyl transferase n=1 Tax=uncultured Desulfuromonas sp. TaxID=181013 RepID=UPI002AAA91C8|nr:isoprenyl transferase [uncultured Desulfuromonas sp.]
MALPEHIAIIMDGNGRWAQRRGLPRIAGHQQGVSTVRSVVEECSTLGIRYLTLYAFSSENWSRPDAEVQSLMALLGQYLSSELPLLRKHCIRFRVIGDLSRLPQEICASLRKSIDETSENSGLTLTLALSYGSRDEVLRAVRHLADDVKRGNLSQGDITEEVFSGYLDTQGIPDPDLLIRTSGEMRISNFLLWQLAYTELYFCSCLWPDFTEAHLKDALADFESRSRRFGTVDPN